jgi:hypothetical protein
VTSTRDGRFDMNAISDVATVNRLARAIEDQEARRLGIPVPLARMRVANRIGVAPGTLENLRRMRTKIVPHWLMNRLRAEFVLVLQSEIQRLEHEIHIARQTGADHRDDMLASAEAQLAAARQVFDEAVK